MIKVSVDAAGLASLNQLSDKMRKAMSLARRDTIKTLKGYMARETAARNYVTTSEVKKATTVEPGGLRVRAGMRGMEKYKLSPTRPRKGKYVVMGAVKRGGLKPLGGNAFLARINGRYRPYVRLTRHRKPIKPLYGPSIAQLVGGEDVMPAIQAKAGELLQSRGQYWSQRLLGGKSK